MPPRKSRVQSESEGDEEEYEVKPDLKSKSTSKRNKDDDKEEGSSEPKTKKSKTTTTTTEGEIEIEENDQGEPYFKLSEHRRLTVRKFKGKILVDIRETYKDKNTGEVKPGAKGLALSKEQWDLIKNNINNVDDMIAKSNEK